MSKETSTSGRNLVGTAVPTTSLAATVGVSVDLADRSLGDFVVFVYPRTGRPDRPEPDDWALIPGAKGCTAESCEFRDLAADYRRIGYAIYGLSSQDTEYQQEAAQRLHLPYPLLSDPRLELAAALHLPTFRYDGHELYKRSTLIVQGGTVAHAELEITDAASHPRRLLTTLTEQRSRIAKETSHVAVGVGTVEDIDELLTFWELAGENDARPTDSATALRALMYRDPDAILLVRMEGRIVGTVIAGWDGWRAHMYRLAVHPDYRRRGIARTLLDAAEARLAALGATRYDAMVLDGNALGQSAWAAGGYTAQAQWRRWVKAAH